MVYTLTLNTSLDYVVHVDKLSIGQINKSSRYDIYPGGKGINVSWVLKELGIESTALGFVAGHTGDCFEAMIREAGIDTNLIKLTDGMTRINIKTRSHEQESVTETDINCAGPIVGSAQLNQMKEVVSRIQKDDILVVSGSVPPSIGPEEYGEMIQIATQNGAMVVVDVTGAYLLEALKYKPFLVKPNEQELRDLFGNSDDESVVVLAKRMQDMGADNVLVSLGEAGALLCPDEGEIIRMEAPKGVAVNTVGAGDSMVAGFVAAVVQGEDMEKALKLGVCAGSATAFSEGLASYTSIQRLFTSV